MPVSAYIQTVAFLVLAIAALFVSAGTLVLVTYWAYLAIFAAVFVASFLLLDPDLARERMRPGGKRPPLGLRLFTGVLFAHWIIAGLDHGRFHWSDTVPLWLQWLGLAAVAASYVLCLWAMRVNRFFSSVVRIQSDRGQVLITAGPYAVVRHPGYIAGIVLTSASGLALDSWLAAALLIACSLPFLLYRTVTEDRVLQAQLPGYRDYAERVPWRLLPGIW
jgi:protein-S-isoprenylcysteine O-methyltransferase Ste14